MTSPPSPDLLELSPQACRLRRMRSSVLTSARLLESDAPPGFRLRPAMVTLTYRPGVEWERLHISAFLKRVREWARRKGFPLRYVWVAELQERGAVHYHVVLWLPFTMPKPDRRGWWPHGSSRVEWARGAVGYLAKYVSKADDSTRFPPGLRLHGTGGLSDPQRRIRRWWQLPQALREGCTPSHDITRAPGGGWLVRATGELLPAMWGLVTASRWRVRLVRLLERWPQLLPVAPLSLAERREVEAFDTSRREPGSSVMVAC